MIAEQTTDSVVTQTDAGKTSLGQYVTTLFEAFKVSRLPWEEIWIESWNNFLAQYQPDLNWRKETEGENDGSRIFIKLTTLKCNTVHAKVVDLLPPDGTLPFDADVINPDELKDAGIPDDVVTAAADRMRNKLKAHFKDIKAVGTVSSAALEMAILGTGVLKGPIVEPVMRTRVVSRKISGIPITRLDPTANPFQIIKEPVLVPHIDHVPLWEYYTDFNAKDTTDAIGEIHFRRLLPEHYLQYAIKGGHDLAAAKEAVARATSTDPNDKKYIHLADNYTGVQGDKDVRVSALEYWGLVPVQALKESGVKIPPEYAQDEAIEAKVCLGADGIVTLVKINTLGRRPFFVCPYKQIPHTILGHGVAWAMRDSQKMINSSARLIIDNKALSGVGMVGVNLDRINTARTKNMRTYPRKTWYTKGNFDPDQAVKAIQFPDITSGLRELMEMFVQFADEETGIPKYMQGEQGSFLNKTATGMSMLMGQANLNIKTVIKNMDDFWIEPIVEMFYEWFLDMDTDQTIKIPLRIRGLGVESLVAKEIKMEHYMKFLQITQDPKDAIFVNRVKAMRNIAKFLDTEEIMQDQKTIDEIVNQAADAANQPKDIREMLEIDKLYPLMSRNEQMQVLTQLGITPDTTFVPPPVPQAAGGSVAPTPAKAPAPAGAPA